MKKVLPVAVAALALSVGGAFAEAPNSDTPGDTSSVAHYRFQQLPDADMATVKGKGLRSEACTRVVRGFGYLAFVAATIRRDPAGQVSGAFIFGAAGAICA